MADTQNATDHPSRPSGIRPNRAGLAVATVVALLAAMIWFWQNDRRSDQPDAAIAKEFTLMPKVTKTDAEWRRQLTAEQYEVTRNKGTERAFTGAYWNHKEAGNYKCIGCGAELFTSETKYDSGCGWPSFFEADHEENLHTEVDRSFGMVRTEVMCKSCGAHLGHVFDDGPQPSGLRYCINSASLDFEEADGSGGEDEASE